MSEIDWEKIKKLGADYLTAEAKELVREMLGPLGGLVDQQMPFSPPVTGARIALPKPGTWLDCQAVRTTHRVMGEYAGPGEYSEELAKTLRSHGFDAVCEGETLEGTEDHV